jgi:hypothetical protein
MHVYGAQYPHGGCKGGDMAATGIHRTHTHAYVRYTCVLESVPPSRWSLKLSRSACVCVCLSLSLGILVRVHMCACIAVCQPGNRRRIYLWMHVHACTHTCICMHMPKRVRKNCARAISVRMPACVCLHACVLASAACMHV